MPMSEREVDLATPGRQGLSVAAAASLAVGLHSSLTTTVHNPIWAALVLGSGFAAVLALATAALIINDRRRLARLDTVTLGVGLVLALARFSAVTSTTMLNGTDATLLNRLAMKALQNNENPYTHAFKLVGADGFGTPLLTGGQANTYGYPPLSLEVGRVLGVLAPRFASPGLVGALALVGLASGAFFALPQAWRPLSTIVVLGLGLETASAVSGLPVVLACALLVLPLWRWTATGTGGRLGRLGLAQAVALGLAAAAQQLSWFVAAFLVLSIFFVRRGELSTPRAALVAGRYAGVAVATFLLANAPFIVADATAWARAMGSTLTQKAIVDGSSWALPAIESNGGTGALDTLSYAGPILLVGIVVLYSLEFRLLAPAVAIVPYVAFLLSSRSNDEYFFAFLPVWIVAAVTTERAAVAASRPPRLPASLRRVTRNRAARSALAALALAVPAAVFVVGVTGAPPMTLRVTHITTSPGRLVGLRVEVANNTDRTIEPQYFVDLPVAITHPWVPVGGPVSLGPHQHATVVLHPRTVYEYAPAVNGLWIFSTVDAPAGMAARAVNVAPEHVTVRGVTPGSPDAAVRRLCVARLFSGYQYDCGTQIGLSAVK